MFQLLGYNAKKGDFDAIVPFFNIDRNVGVLLSFTKDLIPIKNGALLQAPRFI